MDPSSCFDFCSTGESAQKPCKDAKKTRFYCTLNILGVILENRWDIVRKNVASNAIALQNCKITERESDCFCFGFIPPPFFRGKKLRVDKKRKNNRLQPDSKGTRYYPFYKKGILPGWRSQKI